MKYFLQENYYFDIDNHNQLRIAGPENHLLLGWSFPTDAPFEIEDYKLKNDQLEIVVSIDKKEVNLAIPLVSDIRSLRSETEPITPKPRFEELVEKGKNQLLPQQIIKLSLDDLSGWRFLNSYMEQGEVKNYGSEILVSDEVEIKRIKKRLIFKSQKDKLKFLVRTYTNIKISDQLQNPVWFSERLKSRGLDKWMSELYVKVGREVEHLIRTKKTSSFEYGTIFPRDWIEAADLGEGDLLPETIDYMYKRSMQYINEKGEGWHEEIIGDYKTKVDEKQELIDRKMIDIEPHYILGFRRLSKDFLNQKEIREKMKLTALFVLNNAKEQKFISFKRMADKEEVYYLVGNWRDSSQAFPGQRSPLSPYDVNCVFYPEALRIISENLNYFEIDNVNWEKLIEKWDKHKLRFRFYHPDDLVGYALALHGKKQLPLPVAHLDESYDLFYGRPSWEEVNSFAKKVVDPEYFYTPVGPVLVDRDSEIFSTKQYHGQVIWPKQVAFAVGGLARQLRYGIKTNWPDLLLDEIKKSIMTTAEASFRAWQQLGAVPELYYFDEKEQRARFFTDQQEYEGQMSLVQLWSGVGCRRIIREYEWVRYELGFGSD